jgi:hypothetical protein
MSSDKPVPFFPGFQGVSEDILAVRSGLRSRPLHFDIDLSTARSFAAGTALILEFPGNCFYSDQLLSTGELTVYFEDSNFDITKTGFGAPPGFIAKLPFTRISFENVAQPGKTAHIIYGIDLDFTPNPNSNVSISGVVDVVDGGRTRTLLNQAFIASYSIGVSPAGQYNHHQLWNPNGSGKNVFVESVFMLSSQVNGITIGYTQAALATLVKTGNSKKIGGAASQIELRSFIGAALNPSPLIDFGLDAGVGLTYNLKEPIFVPPGYGLMLGEGQPATDLRTGFEWFEEII